MHMRNWDRSRHKLVAEAASPGKAGVNLNTARQRRIEEEHSMKRLLLNGLFASLLLALSAHVSAQQLSGAAGKGEQSPQQAAEASFMSEIGAMRAALGRPLPDTRSSTAQSDRASESSATPGSNVAQRASGSMQMQPH